MGLARFQKVLAIAALLLSFHGWAAEPRLYLLRMPIEQTTTFTKAAARANLAFMALYQGLKAYGVYKLSHHSHEALGVMLDGSWTEVATWKAKIRGELELVALLKRRKDLQKIANLAGVSEIRIFTVGRYESKGAMSGTLHSKSLAFVMADGRPESIRGSEWVPIDNPSESRMRLTMKLDGQPVGPPIEIKLSELLSKDGGTLDPLLQKEWQRILAAWRDSLESSPAGHPVSASEKVLKKLDRHITKRSLENGLSIDSTMTVNHIEYQVADMATGRAAEDLMTPSLTKKVLYWTRRNATYFAGKILQRPLDPPEPPQARGFATRNTVVLNEVPKTRSNCAAQLKLALDRMAGKILIRSPE